jgi:hypothetical protein
MNSLIDAKLEISAGDYLAIMDLFARYAWAWIEDPPQGRLKGIEGVRQFFDTIIKRPIHMNRQHLVKQRLLRGGPDRCEAMSYWIVAEFKGETADTARRGYYTDTCIKIGGEWFFASRYVRYWVLESIPWQGVELRGTFLE